MFSLSTLIYNALGLVVVFGATLIFQVLFIEEDKKEEWVLDWRSDNDEQDRKKFIEAFSLIGCVIALILFLVSLVSKRVFCRVIKCANQ